MRLVLRASQAVGAMAFHVDADDADATVCPRLPKIIISDHFAFPFLCIVGIFGSIAV